MVKVSEDVTAKKRRKTTSTGEPTKPTDDDIYKKVVAYEEAEAQNRSAEKDAKLYCGTCANIRDMLSDIQRLKRMGSTEEVQAQIAEKRVQISILFVLLKKLNRLEKIRTKASRDALHKEKQRVDSTQLQLHNLLYELEHLKKEITKCLQFKSTDEEIDLVPIEEFYKEAPDTISRIGVTKEDDHQLRLARLEWELRQRKQLSELCQKLQSGKAQAATQIVSKQERLDGLAPRLNHILDVTKPLQDYLELSLDKTRDQHNLAYLLPDPLFLLFFQSDAYNQVYDKSAIVDIVGDEDEARQLKNVATIEVSDSESDQDIDEQNERNKRHHRKVSKSDRQEEKRKKLLALHPLSVKVTFEANKQEAGNQPTKLEVTWNYLPQLHIVTTRCEIHFSSPSTGISASDVLAKDTILSELFDSDVGDDSPNSANYYQLRQVGLGKFPTLIEQLGRPYIWAQRVCGFDFLSPPTGDGGVHTPSRELSQSSVEQVMKAIRKRFNARIALFKQIHSLEQCSITPFAGISNIDEYPDKLKCTLIQWKSTDWMEVSKSLAAKQMIENHFITPTNMLYKAIISRGTAKLTALICIRTDFPSQKPVFCITVEHCGEWIAQNCDAIRDMERSVNIEWQIQEKRVNLSWILSAQIRRLLACFDIYLETWSSTDFPQEKIFFNAVRGRNRKRPYKYLKIGGGIFTQ